METQNPTQRRIAVVCALFGALAGIILILVLAFQDSERTPYPVIEEPPASVPIPPDDGLTARAEGGTLKGKVVNGLNHQPIDGAEVSALRPYAKFEKGKDLPLWGELLKEKTVKTGRDGTFAIEDLPKNYWNLWVQRQGYSWTTVPRAKFEEDHVIVLMPACSVRGRVLHEDDTPAVGVHIEYTPQGTHSEVFSRFVRKKYFIKTDKEGYFEYTGIPHGKFTIEVYPEDHLPAPWVAEPPLKPGENRDLGTHYLDGGFGMEVHVLWRGTNEPVEGVEVVVRPMSDPMPRTKIGRRRRTNAKGIAKFGGLGGQVLDKPGFLVTANIESGPVMPDKPGLIAPDSKVTIYLRKDGSIKGRVLDPAGIPLQRFHASLRAVGHIAHQLQGGSDKGNFSIFGVPEGEYVLKIDSTEYIDVEQRVSIVGGRTTDVGTITLHPGAEIYGAVTRSSGKPLEGVIRVFLSKKAASATTGREQFELVGRAFAKQDGSYRIAGIAPGTYWLEPDSIQDPSSTTAPIRIVIEASTGALERNLVIQGKGHVDLHFFDLVDGQLRRVVPPGVVTLVEQKSGAEVRWFGKGSPLRRGRYDVYIDLKTGKQDVPQRYRWGEVEVQEDETTGPIEVKLHEIRDDNATRQQEEKGSDRNR